jgi:hypothetical protein
MTTVDMLLTHVGRTMQAKAERRAARRRVELPWTRLLRGVMQIAGLGWLDAAAWQYDRLAGYCAVGITFILVSAMITGSSGDKVGGRR